MSSMSLSVHSLVDISFSPLSNHGSMSTVTIVSMVRVFRFFKVCFWFVCYTRIWSMYICCPRNTNGQNHVMGYHWNQLFLVEGRAMLPSNDVTSVNIFLP